MMVNVVEESFYIPFNKPSGSRKSISNLFQSSMTASIWSKSMRVFGELGSYMLSSILWTISSTNCPRMLES